MNNKMYSAVFIGHRTCPTISESLMELYIEPLINLGIKYFYNGGMGEFDMIAARAIQNLKKKYPDIKNILVLPYPNHSGADRNIFDEVIYPFTNGEINKSNYRAAIPLRNQYMVDCSSYAISFVNHISNGSYKTLQYAQKQKLKIIELK